MKKALVLLLLVAMVAPVFAEDAKVFPQGVGSYSHHPSPRDDCRFIR
jgi:hypothetical protein